MDNLENTGLDSEIHEDTTPQTPKPENKVLSFLKRNYLAFIIGILLVAIGASAAYVLTDKDGGDNTATEEDEIVAELPQTEEEPIPTEVVGDNCVVPQKAPESRSGLVEWSAPEKVSNFKLFLKGDFREKSAEYYRVGKFTGGKYTGNDIIYISSPCDGMCFYSDRFLVVATPDKATVLYKYSDFLDTSSHYNDYYYQYYAVASHTIDYDFTISDLEFPTQFVGPDGKTIFELVDGPNVQFCMNNLKKVFSLPPYGDVYTTQTVFDSYKTVLDQSGFYLRSPDGTTKVYTMKIDFISENRVPSVTWSDGTVNNKEYIFTGYGGCGATNYLDVIEDADLPREQLTVAGHTSNGDEIYKLKDNYHEILRKVYDNEYYVWDGEKVPYEEFIANHPVFFWEDPFGRVIKFRSRDFLPPAECAKPAIYLYPQTEQKVSVQVDLAGGFTYTEPPYNEGWMVTAMPDGTLIEEGTGQEYPYLFWEGRGGMYQRPEKGFVVAGSEVAGFLEEKLTLLGLNYQERADFTEYWLPKMQDSPYYFVTFLTTKAVDQLAPLTVEPNPDTVIRILMDYEPLAEPVEVEGFDIHTPQREGFTVVEWGGVRR